MNFCSPARLALLLTLIALPVFGAHAQKRSAAQEKTSTSAPRPCTVETGGAVTYLVRNGVELSVTQDWDCDRVPDAYDNCVGIHNPEQTDADRNDLGDVCEAVSFVKPASFSDSRSTRSKAASTTKPKDRSAKNPQDAKPSSKAKAAAAKTPAKKDSKPTAKTRTAKVPAKRRNRA